MPITGAIFDFDGTIVDSMPMWEEVLGELLRRHGGVMTHEMLVETEPLSLDEECTWLYEHVGVGESGEALFEELCEMVRYEYQTNVKAWPHVGEFLQSLAERGIPMVVVSSTPAREVRAGLRAHGLEQYFSDVLFTGEVGKSKDYPDIYLAALERLGTQMGSTWVFEDAPAGVRTPSLAGFPVVALLNDHDGRDEEYLRRYASILAHGYEELSLELIEDYAQDSKTAWEGRDPLHALIVDGSPEPSSLELVSQLAGDADYLIAADRGAEVLFAIGVTPDVFCGDDDSVAAEVAQWAHASAQTNIRFPSEKYATDLGLSIDCARHEAARRGLPLKLTVTCCSGGRPDHMLGVIGLLAQHVDVAPRIVEDSYECRLLSPEGVSEWELSGRSGATFSAVALREGTIASEQGMRWELDHKELRILDDLGISNVLVADPAVATCHAGVLAAFLMK